VNPPERATPLRNISILSLLRDKTRAVAAPRRTAARGSTQHRLCRTGTIQHRAASVGRTLSRCLCRNAFVEMSQASGADGLPGSWPPLRAGSCSPPGRQALRSKHCRRPDPAVPQTAVQLPAGLVKHSDWATLSRYTSRSHGPLPSPRRDWSAIGLTSASDAEPCPAPRGIGELSYASVEMPLSRCLCRDASVGIPVSRCLCRDASVELPHSRGLCRDASVAMPVDTSDQTKCSRHFAMAPHHWRQ
jgi:hypothetical protein